MSALWLALRQGYDRRSAAALALALCTYGAVGYHWRNLIRPELGMDWLLAGIWIFMTGLLCWRLQPREDLRLVLVGLCGGAVIEWWGTTTSIWTYYTDERPPIWILPAWPVAALTIERLALVTRRALPAWTTPAWWVALPAFVLLMTRFAWPGVGEPSTIVVIGIMLGVLVTATDRRRDLAIFVAGSVLGVFLEYWGTSRWCWRYYTLETPPPIAAVAHGFASIAFARGALAVEAIWARVRRSTGA